jgi:glutamyl-tRNA reductase
MLVCISVSYKHASLPVLESLTLQRAGTFVQTLLSEKIAQECVLIQTCHRVEIYCKLHATDHDEAVKKILKIWSTRTGVSSFLFGLWTGVNGFRRGSDYWSSS